MSETKELTKEGNQDKASDGKLEIIVNKDANEVSIRNLSGYNVVKLKSAIQELIEERGGDENIPPLTPEDFEIALQEVDAAGLTFTPELFPSVVAKRGNSEIIDPEKLEDLEEKYPYLPREVGLVIYNILTSSNSGLDSVGGIENFERKSEIVKRLLITNEFRDEFFFRHALKVPYFESIDWEVVLKTHERGVEGIVGIPYALLMLTFHNTNNKVDKLDIHQNVTVAVNKYLIDKLLAALTKVRDSLEESDKLRDILDKTKSLTE